MVKSGWSIARDPDLRRGPYAFNGLDWVGYDDPEIVRVKVIFQYCSYLQVIMLKNFNLQTFNSKKPFF